MESTPIDQARFVVTDVETTGLSPEKHRITEVACLCVIGGEVVDEKRTLVNPEQHIPAQIQRMTGITNAMAFQADTGATLFPTIRHWLADAAVLVGHNAQFDHSFLQASFKRYSIAPLDVPLLCTARLARRLLPQQKGWRLADVASYLGIRFRSRHRALGDARATAHVLAELIDRAVEDSGCETVEDLIALQTRSIARRRLQPESVAAMLNKALQLPMLPGVYRFLDRSGNVLYIGKARNLRERVASYFRAGATHTKKITEMVRRARTIEFEQTNSELAALLLESRLIKELQPSHNTLEKRFRRYAFLRLDVAERFPRLSIAQEIEADGAEYFGPFSSRRLVEMLIEIVERKYTLRGCDGPVVPDPNKVPCLYGQIGRCLAPCSSANIDSEYRAEVERLRIFLSGSDGGLLQLLETRMYEHAAALEFEEAARARDHVAQVRRLLAGRRTGGLSVNDCNVAIIVPASGGEPRQLILIRHGRLAAEVTSRRRPPTRTIERLVETCFFLDDGQPAACGAIEIDEMRIIASYVSRACNRAEFVWVEAGDTVEQTVADIIAKIRER